MPTLSYPKLNSSKTVYFTFFEGEFLPLAVLGMLFLVLNISLFSVLGIRVVSDSPRYLEYANELKATGLFIDPHNIWYIGYPIFILAIQSIHNSLEAIIIAQYVLSMVAVICLYQASLVLFDNKKVAFASALLYIIFFEISIYNSYILCESLYISSIAISLYFLSKLYKGQLSKGGIVLALIPVFFAVTSKPTGVAMIAGFIAVGIYWAWKKLDHKLSRIGFAIFLVIPFFLLINKMLSTYGFISAYESGEIIYGVTQYAHKPFYKYVAIPPPADLFIPAGHYPPLLQMILFIIHHPIYWGQLFFSKLFYFFIHIRPFWSLWHNIFVLSILLPVYGFVLKGVHDKTLPLNIRIFTLSYISVHMLSIGLLTDDWDGRFLLPILSVLFIIFNNKLKKIDSL